MSNVYRDEMWEKILATPSYKRAAARINKKLPYMSEEALSFVFAEVLKAERIRLANDDKES